MGWCKQCGTFVVGWKFNENSLFTYKKICRECFVRVRSESAKRQAVKYRLMKKAGKKRVLYYKRFEA